MNIFMLIGIGVLILILLILVVLKLRQVSTPSNTSSTPKMSSTTKLLLLSDAIQFTDVVINSIGNKKNILSNCNILVEGYLNARSYIVVLEDKDFDVISNDGNLDYTTEYLQYLDFTSKQLAKKNSIRMSLANINKYAFLKAKRVKSVYASILREKDVQGFIILESPVPGYFDNLQTELDNISGYVTSVLASSDNFRSIENLAKRDFLTGLYNRLSLDANVANHIEKLKAIKGTLTFAMIDIDFFKKVNDNYGHQSGDLVLQFVANTISECLDGKAIMHRYGGEEFVIMFENMKPEEATLEMEKVRRLIESAKIPVIDCDINITLSSGVHSTKNLSRNYTDLIAVADSNLYKAKKTGRNKVVSTSE